MQLQCTKVFMQILVKKITDTDRVQHAKQTAVNNVW